MGGHPIGRQPFMAGQWGRYRNNSVVINYKETNYNYGGGFPMGAQYGLYSNYAPYYDNGLTKGEKWSIALSSIFAGAGAVLGGVKNLKEAENEKETETPDKTDNPDNNNNQAFNDTLNEIKAENEKLNKQIKDLQAENKNMKKQMDEINALKAASQQHEKEKAELTHVASARKEETVATTPFKVEAKKNSDGSVTGHTGYNIIAGMYQSEDGTPLTDTEIKALANEIFQGKALKVGNIELPNEITVNGKTYKINPEGKDDVKTSTYNLGQHNVYESGAKKVNSEWIPTLDGRDLEDLGTFATEEEARAAAEAVAKEKNSKQEE